MRLVYKIEFSSSNFYYVDILKKLINEFGINAKAQLYSGFILLDFDDIAENIENFFKVLELKLPISIFVGNSRVIEEFDETNKPLEDKNICVDISYSNDEIIKIIKEKDGYEDIVEIIDEKNGFKIGNRVYSFDNIDDEHNLILTDITKIAEYFSLNQKQMQLLSSIERPFVKCEINFAKNMNNEFGKSRHVYLRFPKSKEEILLSLALKERGVDYIFVEKNLNDLKMSYSENENIILSGDDGIYPTYDYSLDKVFDSYESYIKELGSIYKAALIEKNKRISPSMCVNFSSNSKDSNISIYLPAVGIKPIIYIPNIFLNIDNIFDEISDIDENSQRLIQNYKKKFDIKEKSFDDIHGFEAIISVAAHILGLNSSKEFKELSASSNLKSGLKIDMKLAKIDGINYLDYRKTIQSMMSYKMAGVENSMLCFSFYESLVDLVSDNVTKIDSEIKTKDVFILGDLIENTIYFEKIKKNLKTYNLLIPKSIPISL